MKRIPIKSKRDGETSFRDTEVLGVLPTMRLMEAGETCLFPYDYREAEKSAAHHLDFTGWRIQTDVTGKGDYNPAYLVRTISE